MTLIIGIKCDDGVVMGADGAATLGVLGISTVRQSAKKLVLLRDNAMIGVSGPVGLGQRLQGALDQLLAQGQVQGEAPFQAMTTIRNAFWPHIAAELQAAVLAQQVFGAAAKHSALTGTLVALPVRDQPTLFQFDQQGAPEEATHDLPFVAIGGAQSIADPFLAFLRRIFWKDKHFTLADGVFAAIWTLTNSIAITPGGIAEPIQLAILEKYETHWRVRELTDDELQEQRQSVEKAEKHSKGYRGSLQPSSDVPDVPLPEAPAEGRGA
jgi:20S proteasome alpha/beta subunit